LNNGLLRQPSWIRNALLSLVLVVAIGALYYPVHTQPFSSYDDPAYVTSNVHVRYGLDWDLVKWAFTTLQPEWHPLTWLSHGLDCHLFYLNPSRHHDVNVLLHAVNAVLLFWVLVHATGYAGRSVMVAALFALHPINVQSVAWIAERKNLLSMLFLLLALGAYGWHACKPSAGRYTAVALLYALGLLAKAQIVTFPCLLLLWDYWPLQRMFAPGEGPDSGIAEGATTVPARRLSWLLWEKLPLFALSAAHSAMTVHAQGASGGLNPLVSYTLSARLQNALVSYVRYLGKAFWPSRLTVLYPYSPSSIQGWHVLASLFLLLLISVLAFRWRHRRYLLVGWFWFVGALVPMIGLFYINDQAMADRYAYLPFVGLFIMVVWGVAGLLAETHTTGTSHPDRAYEQHPSPMWLAILSLAVLLALGLVAHRQLKYWDSDAAMWSHAVEVTSNNWVAEDNLGAALMDAGQLDDALRHFRAAVAIFPTYPITYLYLGSCYQQRRDPQAAIEQYQKVITLSDNTGTHYARIRLMAFQNMANAYRDLGDNARAAECLESAKRIVAERQSR
jgi:tetratricopeptide (TPR) repeat protein